MVLNPSIYKFLSIFSVIMVSFDKIVNNVIYEADIILLIIDARRVKESINKKIEEQILSKKKKFMYIINKCDLITKEEQQKIKLDNSLQISATKHWGTMRLLQKIMLLGKGKDVVVGVVGYPNTGKSTVINALKGKHSAPTSSKSGYTKGLQKIRISRKIMLLDTPGVFSFDDKKEVKNLIIGAVDAEKLKDPEAGAMELIQALDGTIEKHYGVKKRKDFLKTLEEIAIKKKILKKGGVTDNARMGKQIIMMWQKGKI